MSVTFPNKYSFINKVNNLFAQCFIDQVEKNNLVLEIIDLEIENIDVNILTREVPIYIFSLKRIDLNKDISHVKTFLHIVENNLYYGFHAETDEAYEGKKYNQILISLFIISAKYIKYNNQSIQYLGAQTINPIIYYVLTSKFGFTSISEPYVRLTPKKFVELSGLNKENDFKWPSELRPDIDEYKDRFINNLIKIGVQIDLDALKNNKNLYFKLGKYNDSLKKFIEKNKTNKMELKQYIDWNYNAKSDDKLWLSVIVENNNHTQDKALNILYELLTKIKGSCDVPIHVLDGGYNKITDYYKKYLKYKYKYTQSKNS